MPTYTTIIGKHYMAEIANHAGTFKITIKNRIYKTLVEKRVVCSAPQRWASQILKQWDDAPVFVNGRGWVNAGV